MTGFSGSAVTAVITMDRAICWKDGRYFVQAANELDVNVSELLQSHVRTH